MTTREGRIAEIMEMSDETRKWIGELYDLRTCSYQEWREFCDENFLEMRVVRVKCRTDPRCACHECFEEVPLSDTRVDVCCTCKKTFLDDPSNPCVVAHADNLVNEGYYCDHEHCYECRRTGKGVFRCAFSTKSKCAECSRAIEVESVSDVLCAHCCRRIKEKMDRAEKTKQQQREE